MGCLSVAGSNKDANILISIARDLNEALGDWKVEDINPKLLHELPLGARAVVNPMAVMVGGIVGQEVVKAWFEKFHHLLQVIYNLSLLIVKITKSNF